MINDSVTYRPFIPYRDSVCVEDAFMPYPMQEQLLQAGDVVTVVSHESRKEGMPLTQGLERSDGIFALLLVCFMVFTNIYKGNIAYFKENISDVFSFRNVRRKYGESTTKEVWLSYAMVFQSVILVSVCLYDVLCEYIPQIGSPFSPLVTILSFIVLIVLFSLLKMLVYRFTGFVFDLKHAYGVLNRINVRIFELLGILLLVPTLLLIYVEYWHLGMIVLMLSVFIVLQLILFSRIALYFIKEKFNLLLTIVYLCSVEIVPYLFLLSGLIYLYRIDLLRILWH